MTRRDYQAVAAFYDAEYAQLEMLGQDVPFFLAQQPARPLDVLELAVGTARAAIPIALAGHRVAGVDYDADLLAQAERKRGEAGLGAQQLDLFHGDAREWRTDRTFDRACIFFNTFLNFTRPADQRRVLRTCRRHLRPGGRLWLDVFNPNLELLLGSMGEGASDLEPTLFRTGDGRVVQRLTHLRGETSRQVQHVTFAYRWWEDGGWREATRSFELTWFLPRELRRLLRSAGFGIESMWGDYDGSPVGDDSPRLIVDAAVRG